MSEQLELKLDTQAEQPTSQLTELPGTTWEDIFTCGRDDVDDSAGLKDTT